jgi:hypothetical protein
MWPMNLCLSKMGSFARMCYGPILAVNGIRQPTQAIHATSGATHGTGLRNLHFRYGEMNALKRKFISNINHVARVCYLADCINIQFSPIEEHH